MNLPILFSIPKEKFFSAGNKAKKLSVAFAVTGIVSILLAYDLNGLSEKLSGAAIMLAREDLIKKGDPDLNGIDFYAFVPFFLKLAKKEKTNEED